MLELDGKVSHRRKLGWGAGCILARLATTASSLHHTQELGPQHEAFAADLSNQEGTEDMQSEG